MAYDGKIMRRAMQRFEEERQMRMMAFERQREELFHRVPRLREIDTQLRGTMSRIISEALRTGVDPQSAVERLRDENLGLQAEKHKILSSLGLPKDILEEKVICPLCGDTGYRNGQVCRCLRRCYTEEQQKELSRMLDLGSQSFQSFSLEWYSDTLVPGKEKTARAHMKEIVYEYCKMYAYRFGRESESLFLFGAPGLGKTHLSAAIAREVSAEGWSVVYDTATHIFERFEQQKFGKEAEEVSTDVERILNCDLLILDDLGTEMTTAFVQSALYQIVSTRLREHHATIISTNLSPGKISDRYSPQIASRIEGEYRLLPFVGTDIRKLKKQRG